MDYNQLDLQLNKQSVLAPPEDLNAQRSLIIRIS